MSVYGGPEINDSGLILHLDASNPKSYPGTGTTWFDLSGNGNHGTLSGFVSNPVFSYKYGGSFYFNGATSKSFITCSTNNGLANLSNFTVIMWGVLDDFAALPNARYYAFDSRVNAGNTSSGLGFDRRNVTYTSPFHFAEDTTGYDEANGPTAFVKNNMYMFGLTRNVNAIQIIDTDSVTLISPSLASNSLGTGNISFNGYRVGTYAGATSGTGEYWWPGHICAVYVYNRVLTQAEIAQHYTCARSRFSTPAEVKAGLILDLDAGNTSSYSGSGSTWTDLSGSGYNATISGSPTFTSSGSGSYFTINNGVSNQYMQSSVPKPSLPVTLSFWAYPLNATASYVALFDTAPYTQNVFRLYSGSVEWWNADPAVAVTPSISSNNWYNFVFIYDYIGNRKVSFYLNGRFITTGTGSTASTYAWSTFVIGNVNGSSGGVFSGRVAKAAIYNRALSAVEIGTNFDALRGRYGL